MLQSFPFVCQMNVSRATSEVQRKPAVSYDVYAKSLTTVSAARCSFSSPAAYPTDSSKLHFSPASDNNPVQSTSSPFSLDDCARDFSFTTLTQTPPYPNLRQCPIPPHSTQGYVSNFMPMHASAQNLPWVDGREHGSLGWVPGGNGRSAAPIAMPHTALPPAWPHTALPLATHATLHDVHALPHAAHTSPHTVHALPHAVHTLPHTAHTLPHITHTSPHTVHALPHAVRTFPHTAHTLPHTTHASPHALHTLPNAVQTQPHSTLHDDALHSLPFAHTSAPFQLCYSTAESANLLNPTVESANLSTPTATSSGACTFRVEHASQANIHEHAFLHNSESRVPFNAVLPLSRTAKHAGENNLLHMPFADCTSALQSQLTTERAGTYNSSFPIMPFCLSSFEQCAPCKLHSQLNSDVALNTHLAIHLQSTSCKRFHIPHCTQAALLYLGLHGRHGRASRTLVCVFLLESLIFVQTLLYTHFQSLH